MSVTATIFESGATSVMAFMQCLEDIIHYMDGFTCCHQITVDTSSAPVENHSSEEVHANSQLWSMKTDTLHFSITRTSSKDEEQNLKSILIRVELSPLQPHPNSILKVHTCWLNFGEGGQDIEAKNRGELRDLVCASLVPAMRVFPILHFLTLKQGHNMEPVPFPESLSIKNTEVASAAAAPDLCMLLDRGNRQVHISINANDQLVTWEKVEDGKYNLKTWSLDEEDRIKADGDAAIYFLEDALANYGLEKDHQTPVLHGQTLLFLGFVLGLGNDKRFTSESNQKQLNEGNLSELGLR
jgi:hypothetical protein